MLIKGFKDLMSFEINDVKEHFKKNQKRNEKESDKGLLGAKLCHLTCNLRALVRQCHAQPNGSFVMAE